MIYDRFLFVTPVFGFIEEILNQAFGGGGGGSFGFEGGFGGGGFEQRIYDEPEELKFPKNVHQTVDKKMTFMKGTEWFWNNWQNVKFNGDQTFDAPTSECRRKGQCKWSASSSTIYILWGSAGIHQVSPKNFEAVQGNVLKGTRKRDNKGVHAEFVRIFDEKANQMDLDLYGLLEVPFGSSEDVIRKAYKKLSLRYHPDKQKTHLEKETAQKEFYKVQRAYETLSNSEKKVVYDIGGSSAVDDLEQGKLTREADVKQTLEVTLEQLYTGHQMNVSYSRRVVCRNCRNQPNSSFCRSCSKCPKEKKVVMRPVGPGFMMQQEVEIESKEKCKNEKTEIEVQIEAGFSAGMEIRFPGKGPEKPGTIPGGLVYTISQTKHRIFKRRGSNLYMSIHVSLSEALLGFSKTMKHLDGHEIVIESRKIVEPFQVIEIPDEGMPIKDSGGDFGKLLVTVEIDFPVKLTESQTHLIEQLALPPVCWMDERSGNCQKKKKDSKHMEKNLPRHLKIVTCRTCRLQTLPEVRRFIMESGGAKAYENVEIQFIQGHPPMLYVFKQGSRTSIEKEIEMDSYSFSELHDLFEKLGAQRK